MEWGRPALYKHSPVICYAWEMKCAHCRWSLPADGWCYITSAPPLKHFPPSAAEYKWKFWMVQSQLPLLMLPRGTCEVRYSFEVFLSTFSQASFFSSWVLRHSCQFPGLYGVVANGTDAVYCEYQGVMWWPEMIITTLFQPSSCFLRRPLCNNTPPFSHTHILFNRISITITICTVEAVLPNGVQTHTSSRFPR